jgi:hypothetical protein
LSITSIVLAANEDEPTAAIPLGQQGGKTQMRTIILSALATVAMLTATSAANACVPTQMGWAQPTPYGWVRCHPVNYYGHNDPYRMMGPYAGAASARAMQAYGVPAPIAGWAGGRIQENYNAAHRERNVQEAIIRGQTGVSMRDIRQHGPLGGQGSEARRACNAVAGIFGRRC